MQIDWTTFLLEVVNFLALVWILKRFLYRPVLETLARRRAGIERALAEAKEVQVQASALKAQFENRLADWEKEKGAARAALDAEMSAERARQMQALSRTLTEEGERSAARNALRQDELRRELEARALAQARTFATALLSRLAGAELEGRLVEAFIEDFASLPEDQLAGLRSAAVPQDASATVISAFPLSGPQRKRIELALAARLGPAIRLEFAEDARLLAGLRASVGPWQLNMNLADELSLFAAAANHAD
jgi:F-type H+-transporting ATPase subunit b